VIEGDAAIRQVVRLLLEDAGHEVVEANDGLSGLALLQSCVDPLVAVIDYRLPRLDGCDLLDLVMTDETLRQRHMYVFMTTDPRRAVDECGETLEELAVPLLPKPFHIDELVEAVHAAAQRLASRATDRPPDGHG
jgi:two-component system chemotaxis response regulator CheY